MSPLVNTRPDLLMEVCQNVALGQSVNRFGGRGFRTGACNSCRLYLLVGFLKEGGGRVACIVLHLADYFHSKKENPLPRVCFNPKAVPLFPNLLKAWSSSMPLVLCWQYAQLLETRNKTYAWFTLILDRRHLSLYILFLQKKERFGGQGMSSFKVVVAAVAIHSSLSFLYVIFFFLFAFSSQNTHSTCLRKRGLLFQKVPCSA